MAQPREQKAATRSLRLAEHLYGGLFLLSALRDAVSRFSSADRRLRRMESALKEVLKGTATIGTKVDAKLVDAVARVRNQLPVWQRNGRGRGQLERDIRYVVRRIGRAPPRKRDLCFICQERHPFFAGKQGGICAECIRTGHEALVKHGPTDIEPLATRTLELRNEDGTSSPVVVRIARPRGDSNAYGCEYDIEGLAKKRTFRAFGEDEVQALWLALVMAGIDLRTSPEGKAGLLTLFGAADLGFPPAEQVTRPEWRSFVVDGEELHWRRYPSWQRNAEEGFVSSLTLEVARKPDAELSVGMTYPKHADVGVPQARALVRLCRETKAPFP